MITLTNAKKTYTSKNSKVDALDGVSLSLAAEGFVCVLGESGCGKTTLLNILGGLDELTGGSMSVGGQDTANFSEADWNGYRSSSVGFVFQQCCMISHMSILKNVELALAVSGEGGSRRERALAALGAVGVGGIADKLPDEVSGGQLQRAAIARAIVNDPSVILADEPTGALDTRNSENIMRLLKELSATKLVVMVTHNRELAAKYATRLIEMSDGKIISDTAPVSASAPDGGAKKSSPAGIALPETIKLASGNLLSKKIQTTIVSVVGSIGIIAVCAVLILSAWFSSFVYNVENDLLMTYGITAGGAIDVGSVVAAALANGEFDASKLAKDDVYVHTLLGELYKEVDSSYDIDEDYLKYVGALDEELYRYIKYNYGKSMNSNIFTETTVGSITATSSLDYISSLATGYSLTAQTVLSMFSYFSELPNRESAVLDTCELVHGSYPTAKEHLVFVVNENDTVYDYALALLGYYSLNDVSNFFNGKTEGLKYTWSYEELVAKKFTYFYNDIVYSAEGDGNFSQMTSASRSLRPLEAASGEGINLEITGVLKCRADSGALPTGLYYTEALTQHAIGVEGDSAIVKRMTDGSGVFTDPMSGNEMNEANWNALLSRLGGKSLPAVVEIFASDVGSKSKILDYLAAWNTAHPDAKVNYVDNVGTVTSLIGSIIDNATVMLIALTGISLIITAVMTGVVSFLSVKERKREIGLLRCLGARRADIARLFSIETVLTGFISGLAGVVAAYITLLLVWLFGSIMLVSVSLLVWWQALLCIAASVVLNLLAGLIPSLSAARMSPVAALRSD